MAKDLTPERLIELLEKHGTLGPYINVTHGMHHVCVDGWINLEMLVEELLEEASV